MLYLKDNFLPTETFNWLNEAAIRKNEYALNVAKKGNFKSVAKFYTQDKSAWDLCYADLQGSMVTPAHGIGKNIIGVIQNIKDFLGEQLQSSVPRLETAYLMYGKNSYTVPRHIDKNKTSSDYQELFNYYKAFIFCHNTWEEDWGGRLCFDSNKYLPKPNRLVIYSLNEFHWVEPITEKATNLRMIFGVRFGAEK
jgi:hypothetical protein